MTMMDDLTTKWPPEAWQPELQKQRANYVPAPVMVDRDPDGNLQLSAATTHDALIRVGHRAMKIAQAMIADDIDPNDPPELQVTVVVHYL